MANHMNCEIEKKTLINTKNHYIRVYKKTKYDFLISNYKHESKNITLSFYKVTHYYDSFDQNILFVTGKRIINNNMTIFFTTSLYFRLFPFIMETNDDSFVTPDATAASSVVNLFIDEINKQDVNGLLQVQDSLYVYTFFIEAKYLFVYFN